MPIPRQGKHCANSSIHNLWEIVTLAPALLKNTSISSSSCFPIPLLIPIFPSLPFPPLPSPLLSRHSVPKPLGKVEQDLFWWWEKTLRWPQAGHQSSNKVRRETRCEGGPEQLQSLTVKKEFSQRGSLMGAAGDT